MAARALVDGWLLREAATGEVFAAGHGETGNDLPVASSQRPNAAGRLALHGPKMSAAGRGVTKLASRMIRTIDAPRRDAPAERFPGLSSKRPGHLGCAPPRRRQHPRRAFVPDRYLGRLLPAGR